MADTNPNIVDAITRAKIIWAQFQRAVGLNITLFLGVKPYSTNL
jgi:hypothetical protein